MTTTSPSIPYSYTADSPTRLRVAIPELSTQPSESCPYFAVTDDSNMPMGRLARYIMEELRSDPQIEGMAVTGYGVDVCHRHATPLSILQHIAAGVARFSEQYQ